MRTSRVRLLGGFTLAVGLLWAVEAWAADAKDGQACLAATDLACAERVRDALVKSDPQGTKTLDLQARTLFFEGRYTEAVAALDALEARGGKLSGEEAPIRETEAAAADFLKVSGKGVEVRYARGLDIVLVDDAIATLERARGVLDDLLGGGPDHPIVLDLFPDGRGFIAASGLPAEAVRTTGVVALSKWTRLLVTSPRALARGYAWKDTIAHEYTHLVVAYRTHDRAPVWLQEGLAKFLEGWWRGENSGHLSAFQQSLLAKAIHSGNFVPFEKFKHSMAYLDSGEEAALAFAQVQTMVAFLVDRGGSKVLSSVLNQVRDGGIPETAVAKGAGFANFEDFKAGWLTWIKGLPLVQDQLAALPVVLDGAGGDFADDPLLADRADLARFARLGDLLREAGRPAAALVEYGKAADPQGPPSPLLLARTAVCHHALGQEADALSDAQRGTTLYPEFALLQVVYAEQLEHAGRLKDAQVAWLAAHDLNPFDPSVQEALVRVSTALGDTETAAVHKRYAELLARGGVADGESRE